MNADRFKYKEITDIIFRSFVTAQVGKLQEVVKCDHAQLRAFELAEAKKGSG